MIQHELDICNFKHKDFCKKKLGLLTKTNIKIVIIQNIKTGMLGIYLNRAKLVRSFM